MASPYEQNVARLQAEVDAERARADKATAHINALEQEHRGDMRRALKPLEDAERALWWLLAQVEKDPKPLRHDADCWLRHLPCFAERLRREGGALYVAQELRWARERAGQGLTSERDVP